MKTTMSRRDFVGGIAVAGAALPAAAAPMIALADEVEWDYEADFVSVGAGCAGIYGAIRASEQGLSALIIDKESEARAGGDSRCNDGLMYAAAYDSELVVNLYSFGRVSENWAKKIEAGAAVATDWLIENGCEYKEGLPYFKGAGPAVYRGLLNGLAAANIPVVYDTRATRLIKDAEGTVIGVKALQGEREVMIKANKGVLIATGSYTCNQDLIDELNIPGLEYFSVGAPYLTGDGLLMGAHAGAKLTKISKSLEYAYIVSKSASKEFGTGIFANTPNRTSMLWVNGQGERFMDELTFLTHNKSDLAFNSYSGNFYNYLGRDGYINRPFYQVFDQACFESGCLGNAGIDWSWAYWVSEEGYIWSEDNAAELERGWILKADTLEELAGMIDVDADALVASVAAYNEDCAAGADPYNRAAESLIPIAAEGPYYAMDLAPSLVYTIGGLTTDDCSRTVDWFDEPIPHLYSAGNVGQMASFLVPIGIPGCMAQAELAALDAAAL